MILRNFLIFAFFMAGLLGSTAVGVSAQIVRQQASNSQLRTLLNQIETRTDTFRTDMQSALNRSQVNNTNQEDRIMDRISEFEDATDTLRSRFQSRQTIGNEVHDVLTRGAQINNFMMRQQLTANVERQWVNIQSDLNTLARYYSVAWNWNQPVVVGPGLPAYTVNDSQLRSLLARIENKTDVYKRHMDRNIGQPVSIPNSAGSISSYISEFENATDRLRERFDARQSTSADTSDVLTRAYYIDQYMARYRVNRMATSQWNSLKIDLNTLASYSRVSWNWNQVPSPYPTYPGNDFPSNRSLTGTYRLNVSRSDNVTNVINTSLGIYEDNQRENVRRSLTRRLASPQMIAFDVNGRSVDMATSNSQRVSFDADGTARTETNPRGNTVRTTASMRNSGLEISYEGDRTNDFFVTFSPSGNQLNVMRRIYLENSNEMVTVNSVYDRISRNADWSMINAGPVWSGGSVGGTTNNFYVPNNTRMTTTLTSSINTRTTQVGDRFQLEVTSPSQYRGAVIEGRVTKIERSGMVSGRANISLDFDTIRVNNATYRFNGIVDSVNPLNGDNISIDNEGTVRDSRSQTRQTVTRAGIGAVIGAIIGAVAGGGEGAAIGAGVGAGAGVGSVLITGRDNMELEAGSRVNLTATAPGNVGSNR